VENKTGPLPQRVGWFVAPRMGREQSFQKTSAKSGTLVSLFSAV